MYTIRCGCHTYVTLEYDGQFVMCLDNDGIYAEEIIYQIEKRTGMDFQNIPINGKKGRFFWFGVFHRWVETRFLE